MKNRVVVSAFIILWLALLSVYPSFASDNATCEKSQAKEVFSVTHHTAEVGKEKLDYTATAGQLILTDDEGRQRAQIFFIAYEKKGAKKYSRPITFAFNGGPGSSSVWLHFGAIGPKRVLLNSDGSTLPPPATLIDNEFSWLAFTDLVFIDPVGTGYSRPLPDKKKKKFYGFKKDIESVGDFMRLYLTRYQRWLSPKFIVGESYGTTRAVGLTEYAHEQHGIAFTGIVLVSPVLEFSTILFNQSNDLPFMLFLPTYAATAWFHKKLPAQNSAFENMLTRAEDWVLHDYTVSLVQGNSLERQQEHLCATQMANLTGLSSDYILSNNLRIPAWRFRKELLRDEHKIIGRMDGRLTGPDTDTAGEAGSYDPSLDPLIGVFSSAVNHYVRNDLKFESDVPYKYINYTANRAWDWSSGVHRGQGYVDVSQKLTAAIHTNKYLKVFIASGYYDLATPYFAVKYTVNHLELDKTLRDNIVLHFYRAGHMMYTSLVTLKKFTSDIALFYKNMVVNQ